MLDHVSIAVGDMRRSLAFYDKALAPLGITRVMVQGGSEELPDQVGYGVGPKPFLWIAKGRAISGAIHIAVAAPDRASVQAFHAAALAAGGQDNGAPGLPPHYHPGYYAAFVLDPDGCNLEAVHHSF